jgi:hypothetical protein
MIRFTTRAAHFRGNNLCFRPCQQMGFGNKWMEERIRQREEELKRQQSLNEEVNESSEKPEEQLTEEEKQMIKAYKVDKMWNLLIKEDPNRNYQRDIILHKRTFEQSTKELRSAILFEDLLKTELDILIYDTKGRPYAHNLLKFFYLLLTVSAGVWSIYALRKHDPKNGVLIDRTT